VLASDEDGGGLDALRFSLASDIVELVVLTTDESFLRTLREAVGGARRLWHVASGDKVSDLLLAGQVGILVLDVQALHEAAGVFISQIKRQFPDLVVIVAGNRDAETSLAGLISGGTVYRFIHKPMSPGRAKMFADAAVRKYDAQRRRMAESPAAPAGFLGKRRLPIAAGTGVAALAVAGVWAALHGGLQEDAALRRPPKSAPIESPLLVRAQAAMAANRLTAPGGDNALELYRQELASNPADAAARTGLAEVHERLLARAENALLEERLDEAASAIETARKAGVDGGRIAFLTAQLGKSREQVRSAQAQARAQTQAQTQTQTWDQAQAQTQAEARKSDPHVADARPDDRIARSLSLAAQRTQEGRLISPDADSARFYVEEALRIDPNNASAEEAERSLAMRLLTEARDAIDRRDFARASTWLEAAKGIASPANVENLEQLLIAASSQAQADAWTQLLTTAQERLQQDRLIEPPNDSAKYYLSTLRSVNPDNAGLASATQDLGTRLLAKARRALALEQYDAARSWLNEVTSLGYSSAESALALRDLETAVAAQNFQANVVGAGELTLLKSSQPMYPEKAELAKIEGWVELDFTVAQSGQVRDIVVHAANPAGIFDAAAIAALALWRYKPVLHDAKPAPQRARIRIRFTLR
jgi:TonB family protein